MISLMILIKLSIKLMIKLRTWHKLLVFVISRSFEIKNILSEAKNRNLGVIAKRPIGNAALLGVRNHRNNSTHESFGSAYDEYFKRVLKMSDELK